MEEKKRKLPYHVRQLFQSKSKRHSLTPETLLGANGLIKLSSSIVNYSRNVKNVAGNEVSNLINNFMDAKIDS